MKPPEVPFLLSLAREVAAYFTGLLSQFLLFCEVVS
jgi:hypothetical protein